MKAPHQLAPVEFEDLRIALVMNGGVSLAVWIGGVTNELNRAVRGEATYKQLLDLTASTIEIDVISGTSAGGINGAMLALAMVFGADLRPVRNVWLDYGSFDHLLRSPFDSSATSLLEGNSRFLDDLREAFRTIRRTGDAFLPPDKPLKLILTTTVLNGIPTRIADDLGVLVGDLSHRGRFVFERGPHLETDSFSDKQISERLALAARATASFPIAFEPVYCPVASPKASPDERLLDMQASASFKKSRFLLDGGILDNKPIEGALEAVLNQRESREARRVLAYVAPTPGRISSDEHDEESAVPALGTVALASLVELPRVESIAAQLQAVVDHNRLARGKRDRRMSLIRELGVQGIDDLASKLLPVYRRRRIEGAAEYVADLIAGALADPAVPQPAFGRRSKQWLQRVVQSVPAPPWVHDTLPSADLLLPRAGRCAWNWGQYAVEHIGAIVVDILRRSLAVVPLGRPESPELRSRLTEHFTVVHALTLTLRKERTAGQRFWIGQAPLIGRVLQLDASDMPPAAKRWIEGAAHRWAAQRSSIRFDPAWLRTARETLAVDDLSATESLGLIAWLLASALADRIADIATAAALGFDFARTEEDREAAANVLAYARFLEGAESRASMVLERLLTLEVVQYATGVHREVSEEVCELVQISANASSPLGGPTSADQKLAGAQFANFGGFLKRGWRANDWMFGRLDGSDRIVRILLNPSRLARIYPHRDRELADALHEIALAGATHPEDNQWVESYWEKHRAAIEHELRFLRLPDTPVPEQLHHCVDALLVGIQLSILREELPIVVSSAGEDLSRGGSDRGATGDLVRAARHAIGEPSLRAWPALSTQGLIDLFRSCRLGSERVSDEASSDLFTSLTTRTLAVGAGILGSPKAGLGLVGRLVRGTRFPLLLVNAVAQQAISSTRTSAFLLGLVLALSGVISLLALHPSLKLPGAFAVLSYLVFCACIGFLLRKQPRLVVAWLTSAVLFLLAAIVWRHFGPLGVGRCGP